MQNVILVGTKKIIADVEYLFPEIPIEATLEWNKEDDILPMLGKLSVDSVIVACVNDFQSFKQMLPMKGQLAGTEVVYVDDFIARQLPYTKQMYGRRMIYWGCGKECAEFEKKTLTVPDVYIDKRLNGTIRNGKQVYSPADLRLSKRDFVIVTSMGYYDEIKELLEKAGLVEGSDFALFQDILDEEIFLMHVNRVLHEKPVSRFFCPHPFENVEMDAGGKMWCCCPAWVKTAFGNITFKSMNTVWTSKLAMLFRLSVINGTYVFCKQEECPYIKEVVTEEEIAIDSARYEIIVPDQPKELLISLDMRCNLKCPQCRGEFLTLSDTEKKLLQLQTDIIKQSGWLEKSTPTLAGFGEVFFSPVYRELLYDVCEKRKEIMLITNGLLLNERELNHLQECYDSAYIFISVDAATEATYRKIRGGNWEVLLENIQRLVENRNRGRIVKKIVLHYCVQMDNLKELKQFVELAHRLDVDRVVLQKIHDTKHTVDYEQKSIVDSEGNPKKELMEVLAELDINDSILDIHQMALFLKNA